MKFVHGFTDRHGKPRFYFRRGQRRVALPGLPGSDEFIEAYRAALSGEGVSIGAKRTLRGSIDAAIIGYYASHDWKALAAGTQKARRAILEAFRATAHTDGQSYGQKRLSMPPAVIMALLETRPTFAAKNWLKTLRGLFRYSVSKGLVSVDPTAGIKLASRKSDGHHTWTEDEIAAFEKRHPIGTKAHLALSLLLHTLQRRGDVVLLGPQHVKDAFITVKQGKTGKPLQIPLHSHLSAAIEATPTGHLAFLVTEFGKPFTDNGFGNWFRERCDEANLRHCSAHGLRKAGCRRLAEAGASEKLISALSGHDSLSEVQRYTKAAEQKRMAIAAMKLLDPENEIGTEIGKPEDRFANSTSNPLKR